MYHLLPPEDKRTARSEYRIRRAIVAFSLLAASAAIFFASLVPSYFLAQAKMDSAKRELASVSAKNDPDGEKKLLADIQSAEARIKLLAPSKGTTVFDALHSAILKKPADIRITGFFFASESPGQVHISGVAETRESLLRYEEILRGEPAFRSVELPISSFASSRNIEFTIVAKGSF